MLDAWERRVAWLPFEQFLGCLSPQKLKTTTRRVLTGATSEVEGFWGYKGRHAVGAHSIRIKPISLVTTQHFWSPLIVWHFLKSCLGMLVICVLIKLHSNVSRPEDFSSSSIEHRGTGNAWRSRLERAGEEAKKRFIHSCEAETRVNNN
jgi:hypothetical protein